MATLEAVEEYLHTYIPISQQIGIRVTAVDETGVTLCAPLGPNLNHEATAFGGSISALAILAGWTYLYVQLVSITEPRRIVIQKSEVQYLSPIRGDFCASCAAPPSAEWKRFLDVLTKRGKGRITLQSVITADGRRSATFDGTYVAMR